MYFLCSQEKKNLLIQVTEKNELRLFFFFCFAKLQRCKIQMAVTITLGSGILTVVKSTKRHCNFADLPYFR